MRMLRRDNAAISEIVGALMLVLIVVAAASSFAIFLSQEQNASQKQALADQERSLEEVKAINFVGRTDPVAGITWSSMNFTITSLCTEDVLISQLSINDFVLRYYNITTNTGTMAEKTYLDHVPLPARAMITVHVDLNGTSLIGTSVRISTDELVKIDIITQRLNDFSVSFAPPSSVILSDTHSYWDGTKFVDYLVLDGSDSIAYSQAYITTYQWTIHSRDSTSSASSWDNYTGQKLRFDFPYTTGTYWIQLCAIDNNGMVGYSNLTIAH